MVVINHCILLWMSLVSDHPPSEHVHFTWHCKRWCYHCTRRTPHLRLNRLFVNPSQQMSLLAKDWFQMNLSAGLLGISCVMAPLFCQSLRLLKYPLERQSDPAHHYLSIKTEEVSLSHYHNFIFIFFYIPCKFYFVWKVPLNPLKYPHLWQSFYRETLRWSINCYAMVYPCITVSISSKVDESWEAQQTASIATQPTPFFLGVFFNVCFCA